MMRILDSNQNATVKAQIHRFLCNAEQIRVPGTGTLDNRSFDHYRTAVEGGRFTQQELVVVSFPSVFQMVCITKLAGRMYGFAINLAWTSQRKADGLI